MRPKCPKGIKNRQHGYPNISEHCFPHGCKAQSAQQQNDPFHRKGKYNILAGDAYSLFGNFDS